jgi:hypothetical protein
VRFLCVEVRAAQRITGPSADSKLLRAFSLPTRLILSPSEDTYVNSTPRSYWARSRPGPIRLLRQVLDQHHRSWDLHFKCGLLVIVNREVKSKSM